MRVGDEINRIICETLKANPGDIRDVHILKDGMTNESFMFTAGNSRYIMRIPGVGTDSLINRENEYENYAALAKTGIDDEPLYLDPKNGYKLTKYIEGSHNCNAHDFSEVGLCMNMLRKFHSSGLKVDHEFNLFDQIEFYESLRGSYSVYDDYQETKRRVLGLKEYIDACPKQRTLCHIDSVCDNFLVGEDGIRLIDWEYAAMQDPHVDVAMFAIYAMYDRENVDRLIDLYFAEGCPVKTRIKIYCYMAVCGLLWSNWCEYKHQLGADFGTYAAGQYRYAEEYSLIAGEMMEECDASD